MLRDCTRRKVQPSESTEIYTTLNRRPLPLRDQTWNGTIVRQATAATPSFDTESSQPKDYIYNFTYATTIRIATFEDRQNSDHRLRTTNVETKF